MDERETGQEFGNGKEKGRWKRAALIAVILLLIAAGCVAYIILYLLPDKGYEDYTLQIEQYYVEYSEEYDYWDVLTVEYPHLTGIEEEVQEQVNSLMYEAAMDRVNYWHLSPSDQVKEFQAENFSIFCSDVICDVPFHSQYLVSIHLDEAYSAGNPIWMTNMTERALTVDLMTGQAYGLSDIFEINSDFVKLWDQCYSKEAGEEEGDDEMLDIMLSWFLGEDEEINAYYQCRSNFYVTEDKNFVIGISLDPVLEAAITSKPVYRGLYVEIDAEELEPYRRESGFWEKYEKSEQAGEVLPCKDRQENIWLGEDASVWNWKY